MHRAHCKQQGEVSGVDQGLKSPRFPCPQISTWELDDNEIKAPLRVNNYRHISQAGSRGERRHAIWTVGLREGFYHSVSCFYKHKPRPHGRYAPCNPTRSGQDFRGKHNVHFHSTWCWEISHWLISPAHAGARYWPSAAGLPGTVTLRRGWRPFGDTGPP